ncbi:hypothetical protein V6N13_096301 [Hibiscus sabdariffa]|uniref:F-box domain-containing protein n=1 Tax=Hibiscus sabdariffa TaxID=183260 RepID=A0ABR2DG38_9ROSI
MEPEDRLSDLPDCLLHHIFGFIDFRYYVQASVLCKRWKLLWTSLQDLYFDGCQGTGTVFFHRFVFEALSRRLRNPTYPLNKVRLHLKWGTRSSFLKKFIAYLGSTKVPWFGISFDQNSCFNDRDFAAYFSRSQFPKTVELTRCHMVPSQSDCQPTWTNLYLHECYFCPQSILINSFQNCVNLKELHLHKCRFPSRAVLDISCPRLVNLVLSDLMVNTRDPADDKFELKVSAPELLSFSLTLGRPLHFSLLHLPALDNVDIRIHSSNNLKIFSFERLIRMFQGLRYAQSVKICSETIEMLTMIPGALEKQSCPFSRLKSLTVTCDGSSNYDNVPGNVMAYFLSNSRAMVEK